MTDLERLQKSGLFQPCTDGGPHAFAVCDGVYCTRCDLTLDAEAVKAALRIVATTVTQ